jgi:hypothetical protein
MLLRRIGLERLSILHSSKKLILQVPVFEPVAQQGQCENRFKNCVSLAISLLPGGEGCIPPSEFMAPCPRAVSITPFSFAPNLYVLDGFPHSSQNYSCMASKTSGKTGVVALWSR